MTEAASRARWFASAGVEDAGEAHVGLDAWARAYILVGTPEAKLAPPPRPRLARAGDAAVDRVARAPAPAAPGRHHPFRVVQRAEKIPTGRGLERSAGRARLLHTFLHHEVQAAELMAHALLRFPAAPPRFLRGLAAILDDEVRHAAAYNARLAELGHRYGDFPVRDWFWQRVPSAPDPRSFVALMGMGLEGGNLEHTRRFERELHAVGDSVSAALVAEVGAEEVAHVRFATRWFQRFSGCAERSSPDFDSWREALPRPLTPMVLRGLPLDRERRARAGQGEPFLDALEGY